jgi:hypothetical protein
VTAPFAVDDGPSLEEAALWGDIAEMADELAQANRELDEARATIARLKTENARLRKTRKTTPAVRAQMGAAA